MGFTYDDADRLITVTDAANNSTHYAYDTENNLSSITDANGHTTVRIQPPCFIAVGVVWSAVATH